MAAKHKISSRTRPASREEDYRRPFAELEGLFGVKFV